MAHITLTGRLRHCFFGDYSAVLVVAAKDAESMRAARPALGSAWDDARPSDDGSRLSVVLAGPALASALAMLESLRTDGPEDCPVCRARSPKRRDCTRRAGREPIDGCRHSIDLGPTFILQVPCVPVGQLRIGGV